MMDLLLAKVDIVFSGHPTYEGPFTFTPSSGQHCGFCKRFATMTTDWVNTGDYGPSNCCKSVCDIHYRALQDTYNEVATRDVGGDYLIKYVQRKALVLCRSIENGDILATRMRENGAFLYTDGQCVWCDEIIEWPSIVFCPGCQDRPDRIIAEIRTDHLASIHARVCLLLVDGLIHWDIARVIVQVYMATCTWDVIEKDLTEKIQEWPRRMRE
jgi:hypothetical protein